MALFKNKRVLSNPTNSYNITSLDQVIEINLSSYSGTGVIFNLNLPDLDTNKDIGYGYRLMVLDNSNDNTGKQIQINTQTADKIDGDDTYVYTFDENTSDAFFVEYIGTNLWTISFYGEGIQGPQGFQGAQGPQGFQGLNGAQGPQGLQGENGVQGPQGSRGTDGTSVTILGTYDTEADLCLGVSSTTPSIGDGYIIGGDLWVYDGTSNTCGFVNVGQIQGPQGVAGTIGVDGVQGPQGPQGLVGATGVSKCTMPYVKGTSTDPGVGEYKIVGGGLFKLNYTDQNGNNWENWLNSYNSFTIKMVGIESDTEYGAFEINNITHETGYLMGNIVMSTYIVSGDLLSSTTDICLDITPSNSSSEVTCSDISPSAINFNLAQNSLLTINDDAPMGLGLTTGDQLYIYVSSDPDIFSILNITSYTENFDGLTASLSGEVVTNTGSDTTTYSDLCFIPQLQTSSGNFLYERTIFVDPNGNDTLAETYLVGGNNDQPFKTIQGAMAYVDSNFSGGKVNIHVHAGLYFVSNNTPIEFPVAGPQVNLHLDDGVEIKDSDNTDINLTYVTRGYLIKMSGQRPSITGYGVLTMYGNASNYIDYILIDSAVSEVDIKVKRINIETRGEESYALYYKPQSGKTTNVSFSGEIYLKNIQSKALLTNSSASLDDSYFVFSENTKVFSNTPAPNMGLISSYLNTESGNLSGETNIFLKGMWKIYSGSTTQDIYIFNSDVNSNSNVALKYIFDGAEIESGDGSGGFSHYLLSFDASISELTFSVLNKTTTNCILNNSINYVNDTFGTLALGIKNINLPKLA